MNGSVINETVTYDYDTRDRHTKTTYPDGSYTQTVYDLAGNVDKERDRFGQWTDVTYDAYGHLTDTLYPDGTTEVRTYTDEGLLETVTDRSGNVTRNEYDDAGRLWKVHNLQDGTFTETKYTEQGWVEFEWDAKRNKTEHRYDRAGHRKKTIRIDDQGHELIWAFEYYPNGELHFETDPLLHTTEYGINALDQRTSTFFANGTSQQERFDLMGRRVGSIDQNQRRTQFDYDSLGRLKTVTPKVSINGQAVPGTNYTYDQVGNKLTQTDANGHTTIWTYDYFGRVLTRTLPENMSESFVYLDSERKVIHTDFNGDVTTTVMDVMGRTQSVSYSKDGKQESFNYWPNDQVKTATTAEGVTEYFYDTNNRLDHELRPDGTRMDYGYDLNGNRNLVKITRNGSVTSQMSYTYDSLNRLETATDDLKPTEVTVYTYDLVGNLDTVTYPNGLITDYDYNSVNQLTDVFTRNANGTVISHYGYTLDNTGRRTVITELSGRTTAYCHDALYRLKSETVFDSGIPPTQGCLTEAERASASYTADYQYDWTGNRTYEIVNGVQTAYTYDDNDRLQTTGGTTCGYDNNGNTLSETLDGATTVYQYNGKNQLQSVTKNGAVTTYQYNPNGIRIAQTTGGNTTRFIVDENRDYAQVLEELENGTKTVSYSYGHDLLSQTRNTVTNYYHYDGLGSTRALSDSTGAFVNTYQYEAFGEITQQTGSAENKYLYTGEQLDKGLNQYYLRARYYNPGIGRFMQMDTYQGNNYDPVSLHKYAYGNADPVTYKDPTGRFSMAELDATMNIVGALTSMQIDNAFDVLDIMGVDGPALDTARDVNKLIGLASLGAGGFQIAKIMSKKFRSLCNSFDGETLVATEFGLVPIKEIKIGDKVWAYDETTGEKSLQEVVHLIQREGQKDLVDIELTTGEVITATTGHPFYLADTHEWKNAGDLTTDQMLMDLVGNPLGIVNVSAYSKQAKVYNLTVNNAHTYFVGVSGALSHNSGKCSLGSIDIWKKPNPSSQRLGGNLENSGAGRPGPDYQAHHIIPANAALAKESQEKLASMGLHADDALNVVWVKGEEHVGRHSDAYIMEVNRRIKSAGDSRSAVLEVLDDLRNEIQQGRLRVR